MAAYRLFKATYPQDGKSRKSAKWYVEFRDHLATVRRLACFTSKQATDELARNLVRLIEYHKATGGQVDPALTNWLAGLPSAIRLNLMRIGVLDSERIAASKPLGEHVKDWSQSLVSKGSTPAHVKLVTARLNKVIAACGFKNYPDIAANKVQSFLADARKDTQDGRGISLQTSNFYLTAIKQFCRWMVRHGRATTNPVDCLDGLNVKLDRRHDRRALTNDEVRKLLTKTAGSSARGGMTGPERRLLYLVALETGLRANELRSLTRSSFDLNTTSPTVTVAAGYSKRRREDTLPLRPALANELRDHLAAKLPTAPAFGMPAKRRTIDVFKMDVADAGIGYCDNAGRVADFHAMRHTFISNLARSGVHPKVAQSLARHSTITLTMDRYSHTLIGEQADALKGLPDLTAPIADEMRKTGTDDRPTENHLASCLAFSGRFPSPVVDLRGLSEKNASKNADDGKSLKNKVIEGKNSSGGSEIRTHERFRVSGFQDRCNQPLCHPS